MPEESLTATGAPIKKNEGSVPVLEKGYVASVQQLAGDVKVARQKLEADKRKLTEHDNQIEELVFNVQLFFDDYQKVTRSRAQVTALHVEVATMRVEAMQSAKVSEEMN